MNNVVGELLDIIKLEKMDGNHFRGQSIDLGLVGRVYGGQILAQSLSAASQTVSPARTANNFHAHFLRAGDINIPIIYKVESLHEGKSFSTKSVTAYQNEKSVCSMNVSFHIHENGFEHQSTMPDVPSPEKITSALELYRAVKDMIPESIREQITRDQPIDYKVNGAVDSFAPQKLPPTVSVWFKAIDTLPDDISMHQCLLAYASDYAIIPAALNPHGYSVFDPSIQATSIDHALWFHRDFRMDEWLLNHVESPNAGKGRGLTRGSIYTRDGKLVATFSQEALIRHLK